MFDMLKYSSSHIVDNRQVNGPLHISVTNRDIETKLFKESDDRTVLRAENMENVMFHGNYMEYKTGILFCRIAQMTEHCVILYVAPTF